MLGEAKDHARCSGKFALIILDLRFWIVRRFCKIVKNTMEASTTYHFAYLGAPGVLKKAPASMFHHIWYIPWTSPRKKSRSLIFIFTFPTWLFSPLATNMGPHGPVWTRISFDIAFIWFIHCFYIVFIWFSMVLYMIFDIWSQIRKIFLHISYHLLRKFQGSFL